MRPEDQIPKQPVVDPIVTQPVREQDKIHLILAYLGILALVPLIAVKDSAFVQWHAKQGLTLAITMMVLLFVLSSIPFLGMIVGCTLAVAWMVCSVMGITKALVGERWRIPIIADISEKF